MNISRATFGRVVAQARTKAADALVHGKAIQIEGEWMATPLDLGRAASPGMNRTDGGKDAGIDPEKK